MQRTYISRFRESMNKISENSILGNIDTREKKIIKDSRIAEHRINFKFNVKNNSLKVCQV